MGLYTKNGLYNGYDKKNKKREALDFYATPTEEVVNILEQLNLDLDNKVILEPCAGAGHMVKGIETYCHNKNQIPKKIIKTDVQNRGCPDCEFFDFFADDYPYSKVDVLIMNPPYSCIEGFMVRALEIAPIVILLGRTQTLEGQSRYENVFKDNPPTKIYQYVNRIKCYKNGEDDNSSSAQAYCWIVWDSTQAADNSPKLKWIFRKN